MKGNVHFPWGTRHSCKLFLISKLPLYFTPSSISDEIVETYYIVLKRGNFGKQNNTHPSSLPTIQKLGCCCFLQAAQTAAQHFMDGLGMENFIFSFLRWQTVRVSQLILLPIVGQRWCSLGDCIWQWLSVFILPRKPKKKCMFRVVIKSRGPGIFPGY